MMRVWLSGTAALAVAALASAPASADLQVKMWLADGYEAMREAAMAAFAKSWRRK